MADVLGRYYEDGEVVIRQGERGAHMYVIQRGRVEVIKEEGGKEVHLTFLDRGAVFGEMGIFERTARSATIRAHGRASILSIDRRTFLRRAQEDPSLAFNVLKSLCARIRRLDAQNADLREKLARATATAALDATKDQGDGC